MNILNYALKLNRNKLFALFKKKREIETQINDIDKKITSIVAPVLLLLGGIVLFRVAMPIFEFTMALKYTTMIILAPFVFLGISAIFERKYIKYKEKVLGLPYTNNEIKSYLEDKNNHANLFNYLNSLVVEYPTAYKVEDITSIKLLLLDKEYDNVIKKLEDIMLCLPHKLRDELERRALENYEKELNIKSIVIKNKEVEIEKEYQSMF